MHSIECRKGFRCKYKFIGFCQSQPSLIFSKSYLRQSGFDRFHNVRRHLFRLLRPFHLHGDIRVARLHGGDVRVELFQPDLHLLLRVVRALLQPGQDLLVLRRAERHVVDLAGLRVGPTAHHPLHEGLLRHVQEDEAVRGDAGVGEGRGLGRRAGEAVQEPAGFDAVGLVQPVFDLGTGENASAPR